MNAQGRKQLETIVDDLSIDGPRLKPHHDALVKAKEAYEAALQDLRDARETLGSAMEDSLGELETIKDDEQGKFDNMPEGLQNGDRGQAMQEVINQLETAHSSLESAKDELCSEDNATNEDEDWTSPLDEAIEAINNAVSQ